MGLDHCLNSGSMLTDPVVILRCSWIFVWVCSNFVVYFDFAKNIILYEVIKLTTLLLVFHAR